MSKRQQDVLRKLLASVNKKYLALGERLIARIQKKLDAGVPVARSVNQAFDELNVGQWMFNTNLETMAKAVALGLGRNNSFAVQSNAGMTKTVLSQSYDASKARFSARLHTAEKSMKRIITRTIKNALSDGKTIKETSMSLFAGYDKGQAINTQDIASKLRNLANARIAGAPLDKKLTSEIERLSRRVETLNTQSLRAAYTELIKKIEKGTEESIQKALWVSVQEKSRYQATVISRTETARAYYAAFESKAVLDQDVTGIKVTLSSAHRIFDICDVHANLDLGYGPGVYPLDKLPSYPLHPHCFCNLTEVYLNKIPENAKVSKADLDKGMKEYLNSLSDTERVNLLGVDGAKTFQDSGQWNSLRNYSGLHRAKSTVMKSDFRK